MKVNEQCVALISALLSLTSTLFGQNVSLGEPRANLSVSSVDLESSKEQFHRRLVCFQVGDNKRGLPPEHCLYFRSCLRCVSGTPTPQVLAANFTCNLLLKGEMSILKVSRYCGITSGLCQTGLIIYFIPLGYFDSMFHGRCLWPLFNKCDVTSMLKVNA